VEHSAVRMQHRRQCIWPTGFRHGACNARQFRERWKGWRVEKIDTKSRKEIGLVAMIGKGSVSTERFVSRIAIRCRSDYPRENDPRVGELLPDGTQQFHRTGVNAFNVLCPSTAGAPGGRPKLNGQAKSKCYVSITLVNAPENVAARFVCEQLVSLEVA